MHGGTFGDDVYELWRLKNEPSVRLGDLPRKMKEYFVVAIIKVHVYLSVETYYYNSECIIYVWE